MRPGKKKFRCCVILTVKNDAVLLEKTLRALDAQTKKPDELCIAVADSTDTTLSVAQKWVSQHPFVSILLVGNATRSRGRNLAGKKTTQEILVFTDAGCFPVPNWLEELLLPFETTSTSLVSGYTSGVGATAFAEAQAAFVLVPFDKIPHNPLPATRNMAILRSVFEQEKGFRETLNYAEDYEFARRLENRGVVSVFAPRAVVRWQERESVFEFFRMIRRLTVGDMLAGAWRVGHVTMWLRYALFVLLTVTVAVMTNSHVITGATVISVYSVYLIAKVSRFSFVRKASYFWAILLQVTADCAVLVGTVQGLLLRGARKTYADS